MRFPAEDREDHRPDNAAERAVHRKKCLEAQLHADDRPTTGDMLRTIGLTYPDPVAAKEAALVPHCLLQHRGILPKEVHSAERGSGVQSRLE